MCFDRRSFSASDHEFKQRRSLSTICNFCHSRIFGDDEDGDRRTGFNKTYYAIDLVAICCTDGTGIAASGAAGIARFVGSDNIGGGGGGVVGSDSGKITCIDCLYDISTRFVNRSNRRSTSSSCSCSGRRRMLLHIVIRLI